MRIVILAAGQGTRLRPLTDSMPKCMVPVSGKSIVKRQIDVMKQCGIREEDILIVCGYRQEVLREHLSGMNVSFCVNKEYETSNMVYSLMCARDEMRDDIIISYGDILYKEAVLREALDAPYPASVVVDDDWYKYWNERCEDPLSDVETLKIDAEGYLTEIGQKTKSLSEIESQYIGLTRFRQSGLASLLAVAGEAAKRSAANIPLWRTTRNYRQMYMTDLLQGLIDVGVKLRALRIKRGWFEIDNYDDLLVAERAIGRREDCY
ncbi:MAG: phosphocholine cytidylyltransferase family protein [Treponema sp.]|jgi:choline kinase|nr:phosphocholine cytidylyltransferase family protein [Treponema sp.]